MKSLLESSRFVNDDFGKGGFTRHLYLCRTSPSQLKAALRDDCHAFQISLDHDNAKVKSVVAEWLAYPTTTCPGAANALMQVTDLPLTTDVQALRERLLVKRQCTHMSDLLIYAVLHLADGRDQAHYHIEVPDPKSEGDNTTITIKADSRLVWQGSVGQGAFVSPETLAGAPVGKGFMKWAVEKLEPKELEYRLMAQQAYFVSISRRYDQSSLAGLPSKQFGPGIDVCFAMQSERVDESYRLNIDNANLIASQPPFWNAGDY